MALPVLASLIATLSTVNLTYHLRAGAGILASGTIPATDTWTFTAAGLPWVDQQWGAEVILAAVERLGGWTGLVVARAALVGLIFGGLVVVGRKRGLDGRTAALLSLAAFVVAAPALALRPQLLGMALFAVVLVLVVRRRSHPRALWLAPLVVLLWANVHGSFLLGPLVLGISWLEDVHERVERPYTTLVVAIVSAIAACVTPFGPQVWVYAVALSTNPEVTARISEWQPTSLRDPIGILFFASVAAIGILVARRGRVVAYPTLLLLGVFLVIGVYAERGVAWWPLGAVAGIAGTIVTPARVADSQRREPTLLRRLNTVVAGVLVVAMVALLPVWRAVDPRTGAPPGTLTDAPAGLTAALRDVAGPGDRLFNPQRWGSWFEYALPSLPVAIDSRIEFFPPEVWRHYTGVLAGADGWSAQLDEWGVTIAVLEAANEAFGDRLRQDGWDVTFEDEDGAIYDRRP